MYIIFNILSCQILINLIFIQIMVYNNLKLDLLYSLYYLFKNILMNYLIFNINYYYFINSF